MIKAIIVDDEKPSLDRMERLLAESGMVNLRGKFTDPFKALEFLQTNETDIAFIDMEMPGMSGMELAKRMLSQKEAAEIVFITAYSEYAVEAFRVNALDYLMKPLDKVRLDETLERIMRKKNITAATESVRIKCFGKFGVFCGKKKLHFRTAKAEELMALLLDRMDTGITRDKIIDMLWREFDGDRACAHFNTTLYYVKKALMSVGIESPIENDRGVYRLKPDGFDCDCESLLSASCFLDNINNDNIGACEKAVASYTEEYLEGNDFIWAENRRQEFKERYLELILAMAAYYKAKADHVRLVSLLKKGIKHEPLHGEINYLLIEATLFLHDTLSAIKQFTSYERRLKTEYGIEPEARFAILLAGQRLPSNRS